MPRAKLSSLPLNHFATPVVMATISDSAPMPKTKRPATIMGKAAPKAVMTAPIRQSTLKIRQRLAGADAVDQDAAEHDGEDIGKL